MEPIEISGVTISKSDSIGLIKNLKGGNVVAYIGAGVSIAAGFDDWKGFLNKSLAEIKKETDDSYKFEIAEKYLKNEDLILAAELINIETDGKLSKKIKKVFSTGKKPSSIHKELTRLPFKFAITTNFDSLLEQSFEVNPPTYKWNEFESFFSQIKERNFAILKLHGDSNHKGSPILDKKNYKETVDNVTLNHHLLNFLSENTFFFIGSSLKDPDLVKVLEKGKDFYKENFGPHYAILFSDEADDAYCKYIYNFYGIRAIIIDAKGKDEKTSKVVELLRVLSGKISRYNNSLEDELISLNSENFIFNDLVKNRIRNLYSEISTNEIFLFFIESRSLPTLKYAFSKEYGEEEIKQFELPNSKPRSNINLIANELYEFGMKKPKTHYIKDSSLLDNYPDSLKSFPINELNPSGRRNSLVISQIFSEGECVGILIIKSNFNNAFTDDHIISLNNYKKVFSALFRKLELRNIPLNRIKLKDNTVNFQQILNSSLLLKDLDLQYIFYEIDYRNGKLKPNFYCNYFTKEEIKKGEEFYYNFSDKSLATFVLEESKEVYIHDLKAGVSEGKIAENGLELFKIESPVYGTPIKIKSHNSFILVCWSRKKGQHFYEYQDKISRIAHLIANSSFHQNGGFQKAEKFINLVNSELKNNSILPPWKAGMLKNETYRIEIIHTLLKCLINDLTKIKRVRLWLKLGYKYECINSFCSIDSIYDVHLGNQIDNYKLVSSSFTADVYCQFTEKRFVENPFSLHQHKSMFGDKEDENTSRLFKDPDGKWIVCPIVNYHWDKKNGEISKRKLVGFLSADNHSNFNGEPKDVYLTQEEDGFQRYILDLISDLLSPVVRATQIFLQYSNSGKS